jgi:hypothetical protein
VRLAARVAKLEAKRPRQQPDPCPECGALPEGFEQEIQFRLDIGTWGDPPPQHQYCRVCRRQTVYAIEFDRAG